MKRGIRQANGPVVWQDAGVAIASVTHCKKAARVNDNQARCSVCGAWLGRYSKGKVYNPPECSRQ